MKLPFPHDYYHIIIRFPQYLWLSSLRGTLMLLLPRIFHYNVKFTTHLGDGLEKPAFKKRAACVFIHRAVTSASESKVCVFSLSQECLKSNGLMHTESSYRRGFPIRCPVWLLSNSLKPLQSDNYMPCCF